MARLIGNGNVENFGENYFISKIKEYLDDTNIIYWNRQVFGREFDVCILMPGKGILVVELKGWREENILRVENNEYVVVKTEDGEIMSNPQKQAKGYRFSLERYIKQNINKFPLVYQMVCLPQVSKKFYDEHRLDVVMEEKFTILKEDLDNKTDLFNKLDQALREVNNWKRSNFDQRTMLEVRNLFETDINLEEETNDTVEEKSSVSFKYHQYDYSRFYYFDNETKVSSDILNDIVSQYFLGCKIYAVFSNNDQMKAVTDSIDTELSSRGLRRVGDKIEFSFDNASHTPSVSNETSSLVSFHCSLNVTSVWCKDIPSFCIKNGRMNEEQENWLEIIEKISLFNREQYLVEHTAPEKNIIIRAGAGTGKTYTMISRIGYICYSQNVPLQKMIDRIVMITFTNEAADQMKEKIKAYFLNCYLLTSNPDYLYTISFFLHKFS